MRVYRINAWLHAYRNPDDKDSWYRSRHCEFDLHAGDYQHAKLEAEAILRDTCKGMSEEFWDFAIDQILPTIFPSYPRSDR